MSGPVASPSVRKRALDNGIDPDRLAAELGRSWISADDVERRTRGRPDAAATASAGDPWAVDPAAFGPGEWVEVTRFNRIAAANLAASQQRIPAVTHHDRADMRVVEAFRRSLAAEAGARAIKLTALAFHAKALATTLKAFPKFNSMLSADGARLWLRRHVDIGIAVDTPHGLMVPVLRGCDRRGLWSIAAGIADLAARAQARRIRPNEMGGASMSITNLGGIGGRAFSPIVNPPEVAILGLTRASIEPVWDGEAFVPTPMCPVDLSYDHRVINGADAARFIAHYAAVLADPRHLLL